MFLVKQVLWLLLWLMIAAGAAAEIVRGDETCNLPNGNCRLQNRGPLAKPAPLPHPAWRYEEPRGHRAAIVRIYCQDTAQTRSIGSGTLVTWGGKLVVLTARHVIKDAKNIIVELYNKRTHWAKVVKTDATWDCAVMELVGTPEGVEAVEVELGQSALQREGDRLESCGYGSDGKLACNGGLFLGYRRSTEAPNGPDDWMAVSGHARGGDSGGGVFNSRGKLVGVLWGTDGKEVICVQAGRIHALLDAAVAARDEGRKSENSPLSTLHSPLAIVERNPTPPRPGPLAPVPRVPLAQPVPPSVPLAEPVGLAKKPLLPWRDDAEKRDQSRAEQIDKLIELERLRMTRESQPPVVVAPSPKPQTPISENELSPLLAGLTIFGSVAAGCVVYFATRKN